MNETTLNKVRIAIIAVAAIAVILNLLIFARPQREFALPKPKATLIPPQGVDLTKRVNGVPGSPEKTAAQMQQIYNKILLFQQSNGCLPSRTELVTDYVKNYKNYGFASPIEALTSFDNPDMAKSDRLAGKKIASNAGANPFMFPLRPDGSRKCGTKTGPGRDVLMFTEMYVHLNAHLDRGDKVSHQPVGFYMVLWDDGKVEQIPFDRARFAKKETSYGAYPLFNGQYGADKIETQSFAEYFNPDK